MRWRLVGHRPAHGPAMPCCRRQSRPPGARRQPRPFGGVPAAASASYDMTSLFGGEDFYTILGVPPTAEPRDIKRAYHSLMRQFHPDRAPDAMRDDMASLCVLLNEIYETLSDEEKRSMYDTLAGFSSNAINPFLDTGFARDQIFVDEISCIGCGKCVRACPMSFEIEASKYGRARVISQEADEVESLQIAIECCPVDCIHWVSLPQLSLLEVALANMGRIEVSVMQRFGRSGGNVFQVAYKAWEQRLAAIQERAAAAAAAADRRVRVDWSFWTNGASLQYDEEAEQRARTMDPQQRRIANLAASAARAARMWRFYNEATGGGRALLTESSSSSMDV